MARDLLDAMDFVVERPRAIHYHMMLIVLRGDGDAVGMFGKQIDSRRAEERETTAIDGTFELGHRLVEQDGQRERVALDGLQRAPQNRC